jgi:transcriptional regulator with PAS, ATPase and Fis domain
MNAFVKPACLVGISKSILQVEEEVSYAAGSHAKVLITGESGVGKEIVARMLHERSSRSQARLVVINCAGVPDSLLESELFGHVRGSFTGAHADRQGLLEYGHGGTVFLDEVGEMSPRMQAMLLRFLETGEIQRVGSDRRLPQVDVRVITATHRRLIENVADRTFREDLYYRLNVVHIEVPPLRERREDVSLLLHHFLTIFSDLHKRPLPMVTPEALGCLTAYDWPGNVRELRNVSERIALQCRTGTITMDLLPVEIRLNGSVMKSSQAEAQPLGPSTHAVLFDRVVKDRQPFWSVVYEPFMSRDLTRDDLRSLISMGLEHTRGNYKMLVTLFNLAPGDYKRFLNFLRKYQCHVPFQGFRMLRADPPAREHTPTAIRA